MNSSESASPPAPPHDDGNWLRALRAEVEPTTFKKGREYAEGRKVSALARQGERVSAKVIGSEGQQYEVAFRVAPPTESQCSCDAWNKTSRHCKHVVAAALIYMAKVRSRQQALESLAAPPPGAEPALLPALAKVESWLGLSAMPDFEFVYRLTPAHGPSGGRHWVIDVRRHDGQAKGPIQVKRVLTAGMRISPADERIFAELARHESRYDSRILVSDEELADLLELLRHRRTVYRGTALLFALEAARPQIHLESKADGALARIDFALPDGSVLNLREANLLAGRRTFLLASQTVYPVEPELPPRLLRKWLLEPSMAFESSQIDRVLTFFAAHLPRFRLGLQADGIEVDETTDPKFIFTVEGDADKIRGTLGARYGTSTVPVSPTAIHLGYATGMSGEGQGQRKLYRRREELERQAGQTLLALGFKFDPVTSGYEAAGDAAVEFWAEGQATLPKDWEVFGAATRIKIRPRIKPRVKVAMSGVNWFELDAEFSTDDQSLDLGAVRMWLNSGRKYVPLKDGSFAPADANELKRAADLLEEAGAHAGKSTTRLPLYQAAALDLLGTLGDVAEIESKARAAIDALKRAQGIPDVELPPGLNATLRHYQGAGLAWLWFLHRYGLSGILADDMGLGKTLQALALLQKNKTDDERGPSLVVAPTSVLPNWEREVEKFTPSLKAVMWHGQDRHEQAEDLEKADLVLTSYALVRRDLAELSKVKFRYVVLDEAQNIKNADSATAQACKSLVAEHRLALTGTPLENRLSELWSIFDFLMPGFLSSAEQFRDRFEHPIMVEGDVGVRDRLRHRIAPFVLRRLKTEVAKDLPPKTETVAYCEMEPAQAALYREVLDESRTKVQESITQMGFQRSRVSILAALMKLRQVCCDPRLLKLPPGTSLPPSAKLERFEMLVNDLIAEGHRALVFSQFTEMLELLKNRADERGWTYQYLDGRTKDRMSRVDAFNQPDGPPLFFISLKAGGTGLNLTAADYVIHFDPWWNPAVEDQATDRTHRIGQTKAVISYKLITRNTVEEKILSLQRRKRELAAGLLSADTDIVKTLTEQDVEELFRME